ncbi:MAG TPA: Type 1 glutamine amidotransferase-like domain-containing protein [Thermoanaerobaculia bacterium]|jgi:peptidase E|nr:Type 1 glutamine amidotransferase-like domain-containing protein [Thermoanaerobaculia bacterium]
MSTLKPIFLLADSQLLFWRDEEGKRLLDRARAMIDAEAAGKAPKAAYLGASNGDLPEFYDLFVGAMAEIGIRSGDCLHIPSRPGPKELDFLADADLVLLAGGDVQRGWREFEASSLKDKIVERYYAGAVLIGVSAGAVQLGLKGWSDDEVFDTFRLVPFVIDVHDEPAWSGLLRAVPKAGELARGFGIPSGGGALYHPDYSLEPVRHTLTEVESTANGLRQAVLFPGQRAEDEGDEEPRRILSQEEIVQRALQDLGAPDAPDDSGDSGDSGDPVN